MYTPGFTCEISDIVTVGTPFALPSPSPNQTAISTYLFIPTGGTEGGIVYENATGQVCFWPYAYIGYNPISAIKILASATINSVLRTTTATPLYWAGDFGA